MEMPTQDSNMKLEETNLDSQNVSKIDTGPKSMPEVSWGPALSVLSVLAGRRAELELRIYQIDPKSTPKLSRGKGPRGHFGRPGGLLKALGRRLVTKETPKSKTQFF